MPPWREHVGILEKRTVFCRQKFSLQGNQHRLSIKGFIIKANITISFGSQAARNLTPTQRVPGFFGSRASLSPTATQRVPGFHYSINQCMRQKYSF
jgi:hypothetical protein